MAVCVTSKENEYTALLLANLDPNAPRIKKEVRFISGYITSQQYLWGLIKIKKPVYDTKKTEVLDVENYKYDLLPDASSFKKKIRWTLKRKE